MMRITSDNRKPLLLVLAALLLAMVLWAGAAHQLGLKAEGHLSRGVAGLNKGPHFRVLLTDYQRGFFSSEATTQLQFSLPSVNPGADVHNLTMRHLIRHGPLPPADPQGWGISRGKPLLAMIDSRSVDPASPAAAAAIEARTTIDLTGRATTFLRLKKGEMTLDHGPEELLWQWQQLEGELYFPVNLRELHGTLRLPGLALREAYPPETGTDPLFSLQDFHGGFGYRRKADGQGGGNLAADLQLETALVRIGPEEHGPLHLELTWANFDQEATTELFGLAPWWLKLLTDPNGRQIPPAVAQALVESIPRLLAKSPVVEVKKARLQTAHGEAAGRLRLAYAGRDNSRIFHPIMLLSGLQLAVTAQAPAGLPDKYHNRLTPLRQRGYLAAPDENGEINFSLHYQSGALEINGRPAPIQSLLYLARRAYR